MDNDPHCLQHKVYFDIAYFMGKCGKEGLRELKKSSFILKNTSRGCEYLELTYNEATKKSQGDYLNEMNDQPILLSQEGNKNVQLHHIKCMFQSLRKSQISFNSQIAISLNQLMLGTCAILLGKTQ